MIEFINAELIYPNKKRIGPINLKIDTGEVHLITRKSGSGDNAIMMTVK